MCLTSTESEVGKGSNFWFKMESRADIMESVLKSEEEDTEEKMLI